MMKFIISEILIPAIAGGLIGVGCGIGLWPIYEQPKNIKIQTVLSISGIIIMATWVYYFTNLI